MPDEQLVHAYLRGDVSRRTFIRRLVAAGLSLSAAIAYTHALRPALAAANHGGQDIYPPPGTVTQDPQLGADHAVLMGLVDPNFHVTTYHFDWGTSSAYGRSTPGQQLPATDSPVGVSATLVGLDPGREYHYRVVASNSSGQSQGADKAFRIPDAAAPTARVRALTTELAQARRRRLIELLLAGGEPLSATLRAEMPPKPRRRGKKAGAAAKPVVVARGALTINEASSQVARLRLTRAGRSRLKGLKRASLTVIVDLTDLAGNKRRVTKKIKLS